jgi:hypothetical protein
VFHGRAPNLVRPEYYHTALQLSKRAQYVPCWHSSCYYVTLRWDKPSTSVPMSRWPLFRDVWNTRMLCNDMCVAGCFLYVHAADRFGRRAEDVSFVCVHGHVGHWVTPCRRHRLYRRLGLAINESVWHSLCGCIRYVGDFIIACVVRCNQYTRSFRYGTKKPFNFNFLAPEFYI